MAVGTYGTIRPADVSPEDVEIILNYTPSRDQTTDFVLKTLDAPSILRPYFNNTNTGGNAGIEVLGGLYNLTLPAEEFNQIGIYVKGIVIDLSNVPEQFRNKFVPQGLVGFRIEYLNADGSKVPNFFRIVTSCFYCEPVVVNQVNTTQKAVRYRYVDGVSNLMFLTVSPSSSPTNKPNATPFIGQPSQSIIISNTFFNPITIEVDIVEYDTSSLAIALFGNQTKSIDDGVYTMYDSENNIYKQYNLYEIRDQFNALLYEVRQDRGTNIDYTKNFTTITE